MELYQHLFDFSLTEGAFFTNHTGPEQLAVFNRNYGRQKLGLGVDHSGETDGAAKSATANTLVTGLHTFSSLTGQNPAVEADWLARFAVGQAVKMLAAEDSWMEGTVYSRSFTEIVITATSVSGSGSFSSWHISPITGGSFLQGWDSDGLIPLVTEWDYAEDQAQFSVVATNRTAIGAASKAVGGVAISGHFPMVVQDSGGMGWALFAEAVRANAAAGRAKGAEIGAATMTPIIDLHPARSHWPSTDKMAVAAWLTMGADATVLGQSYAGQAYWVTVNNGAVADRGGVFLYNSLKRDGQTDVQVTANKGWHDSDAWALSMAYRHMFEWSSRDPLSGERPRVFSFGSRIANPAAAQGLEVTDGGLNFYELVNPANSLMRVAFIADAEAYTNMVAGEAGQAPHLLAAGVATNINHYLGGKGTGLGGFLNAAETTAATPTWNRRQKVVLPNGEQMWVYGELIP